LPLKQNKNSPVLAKLFPPEESLLAARLPWPAADLRFGEEDLTVRPGKFLPRMQLRLIDISR